MKNCAVLFVGFSQTVHFTMSSQRENLVQQIKLCDCPYITQSELQHILHGPRVKDFGHMDTLWLLHVSSASSCSYSCQTFGVGELDSSHVLCITMKPISWAHSSYPSELLFAFQCVSCYIVIKYEGYWNIFFIVAFHCISWGTRIYHERSWRLLIQFWSFMMNHDYLWHITIAHGKIIQRFIKNHDLIWFASENFREAVPLRDDIKREKLYPKFV